MLFILLIATLVAWILSDWTRTAIKRKQWRDNPNKGYSSRPDWEGSGWLTFCVLMFGPILILFCFAVGSLFADYQLTRTADLAALKTSNAIQGQFFLGSGTVDEEQVIRYIERSDDGSVVLQEVAARKARIYEGEDTKPYLDIYCNVIDNPWLLPFRFEPNLRCGYYFHIPAGSVLESYEVAP